MDGAILQDFFPQLSQPSVGGGPRTDNVVEEGQEGRHDGGEDDIGAAPDETEGGRVPHAQGPQRNLDGHAQDGRVGEQAVHEPLERIEAWLRPHLQRRDMIKVSMCLMRSPCKGNPSPASTHHEISQFQSACTRAGEPPGVMMASGLLPAFGISALPAPHVA